MMRSKKPKRRCFVNLPDGTQKDFPDATNLKQDGGAIEIWDDHVLLARYNEGEHKGVWINPQFLVAQKKKAQRHGKTQRSTHSKRHS